MNSVYKGGLVEPFEQIEIESAHADIGSSNFVKVVIGISSKG